MKRFLKMNSLEKIIQNNNSATEKLKGLKQELEIVKREIINRKKQQLIKENGVLSEHVEKLKFELISLEQQNGKKHISIPGEKKVDLVSLKMKVLNQQVTAAPIAKPASSTTVEDKSVGKQHQKEKEKKPKKEKVAAVTNDTKQPTDDVHVGLLDLRIGKIVEVSQHPDADSLYLEKIDCGEPTSRTVISGLVKFVPIDEMKNRLVVVLCNLKPAKMRGIVSEAMVMCASTPEKVEILNPPSNCVPGDLVYCEGYDRIPPTQLNPKKKIFETVAVDLKTNSDLIACYKDKPLYVQDKGEILSKTLKNVQIK